MKSKADARFVEEGLGCFSGKLKPELHSCLVMVADLEAFLNGLCAVPHIAHQAF